MEFITLKNTDLNVSRLCMGGCPMGGYGWGNVTEKELIDAVHAALDAGVNFFDTADTYGLGQSELTLGKALGAKRPQAVISDKFGVHAQKGQPTTYDNSRDYIIKACEASLKRLHTDYIDLYTVHYRDGKTPLSQVIDTLDDLKKQGKIRYYALSNIHEADKAELRANPGKFVCFQNEYSLACRKNEKDMFDFRDHYAMTPLTWGSLGQGILSGKYNAQNACFGDDDRRSRAVYVNFHGEKLKKNLCIVEQLQKIAAARSKPVPAVAIRFILDYIADSAVLVGVKRPAQLQGNVQAADWHLSSEELQQLLAVSSV